MALAATRALGRAGIPAAVMAEEPHAPAWASRHCTERIAAPDADRANAYVDFVATLADTGRYSGLFCCDDRTALHLGRQRHRLQGKLPLLLPEQPWVERVLDKHAMSRFAVEAGIPLPATAYPTSVDDLPQATNGMRYPLAIKGTGGSGASDVIIVQDASAARQAFTLLAGRVQAQGLASHAPHVQEWVQGPVYSELVLCQHGQVLASFQMLKQRTHPVWGGAVVQAISVNDAGLRHATQRVLDALPWHGVLELEFIRDVRDGRYLLVEPSPDPNWGLDLAIHCGVNLPALAWHLMQGDVRGASQVGHAIGRRYVWWLPEGLLHAAQRPSSIGPMLAATLAPDTGCDLRQSDWRPLRSQLRRTRWAWQQRRAAPSTPPPR